MCRGHNSHSQLEMVHQASLPMALPARHKPFAAASGADWEVSFCHTAPGLELAGNNDVIKFGESLGLFVSTVFPSQA